MAQKKSKRKLNKEEVDHLLDIIKKHPRISLKRLAKHFGVNKPRIKKELEKLAKEMKVIKDSIIEQSPNPVKIETATFKDNKEIPSIGV